MNEYEFCKDCPLNETKKQQLKSLQLWFYPKRISPVKDKIRVFITLEQERDINFFLREFPLTFAHYIYLPINACQLSTSKNVVQYCYTHHDKFKKVNTILTTDNIFILLIFGNSNKIKGQITYLIETFFQQNITKFELTAINYFIYNNPFTVYKIENIEINKTLYLCRLYNFTGLRTNYLMYTQAQKTFQRLQYIINQLVNKESLDDNVSSLSISWVEEPLEDIIQIQKKSKNKENKKQKEIFISSEQEFIVKNQSSSGSSMLNLFQI